MFPARYFPNRYFAARYFGDGPESSGGGGGTVIASFDYMQAGRPLAETDGSFDYWYGGRPILALMGEEAVPPAFVLTIDSQPTTGVSTVPLGTIVVDSDDATFTGNVTLSIASGSGSLSGTTVVAAVAGVATFTNVIITGTGAHTLTASASDHTSDTTATITMAAIALAITSQPSIGYDEDVMGTFGIVSNVPTSTATVTVAIQSGGGTLSGTTAKVMVSGAVAFSDLEIAGTGAHVLRFTATGHTLVDSATVTILEGDPPASNANARRRRTTALTFWRMFRRWV